MKPLVKWAGGKKQILKEILEMLPDWWNTYFEPFFGGGALFLELHQRGLLRYSVISDLNHDLYNLYLVVKNNPSELSNEIERMIFRNERDDYYNARFIFNDKKDSQSEIERAALLIYLNRHCYNGLYRVNSKGEFNVPFGKYRTVTMPSKQRIAEMSNAFQTAIIVNQDFEAAVKKARDGDFVYFDPPYEPVSKTSAFTSYTPRGFGQKDQERLRDVALDLWDKNVNVMVSNSDTENIRELYDGFYFQHVSVNRMINSKAEKRRDFSELVITNYLPDEAKETDWAHPHK